MNEKHYLDSKIASLNTIDVLVAGCGGTGSQMLTGLASMNHALEKVSGKSIRVIAFDADTVSETNVGRQAFFPVDVGRNKAQALIERINYSYGLNWKASPTMLDFGSVQRFDGFFISCVDSASARSQFAKYFTREQSLCQYWLDLGNRSHDGQFCLGRFGQNESKQSQWLPSVTELFPEILSGNVQADDLPSCSMLEALQRQSLLVNRTLVCHAQSLLWSLLFEGAIDHCGGFVNLKTGRVNPISINKKVWEQMGCSLTAGEVIQA